MKHAYVTLLMLISAGILLTSCKKTANQKNSGPRERIPVVEVLVVKPQSATEKTTVVGTLYPAEEVSLQAEVPGKIIELGFEEGSKVKKGQLLVRLKDDDLQAQLKKSQLQLEMAEKEEFRKRKLLEVQGISQEEYDAALNQVNTLKADIEMYRARIDQTRIYAPFEGVIGLRAVSIGSYVTPSTIIATLQQIHPLKLEFSVPEEYAEKISPGQTVQFTTGDSRGIFPGKFMLPIRGWI